MRAIKKQIKVKCNVKGCDKYFNKIVKQDKCGNITSDIEFIRFCPKHKIIFERACQEGNVNYKLYQSQAVNKIKEHYN